MSNKVIFQLFPKMIYTIDILSDPDEKKMHNHDLKRIYITLYVENLKDLY